MLSLCFTWRFKGKDKKGIMIFSYTLKYTFQNSSLNLPVCVCGVWWERNEKYAQLQYAHVGESSSNTTQL